jgi:hypothetical protein
MIADTAKAHGDIIVNCDVSKQSNPLIKLDDFYIFLGLF